MGDRINTLGGTALLLLSSAGPFLWQVRDPYEGNHLGALLLELSSEDDQLVSDVLQLRLGLERGYDGLIVRQGEIERLASEFVHCVEDLPEPGRSRLLDAFRRFSSHVSLRQVQLEEFATSNATLNNSLRLLDATHARARAEGNGLGEADLDRVYQGVLQYYAYTDPAEKDRLGDEIDGGLERLQGASGAAGAMLEHARTVVDRMARLDESLSEIVTASGSDTLNETFRVLGAETLGSSVRVARQRQWIAGTCMLTVILICVAGAWWVMRQNRALEREVRERARADSEARRLEVELRQAQQLESIGRLASGIAHEINTPVQFVNDSLHFVRESVEVMTLLLERNAELRSVAIERDETRDLASAIERTEHERDLEYLLENSPAAMERAFSGLDRITKIVRSMRELAPQDGGGLGEVDVNRTVENVLTIVESRFQDVAEMVLDLGEVPQVIGHAASLGHALLGIVVNAGQAIEDVVRDGQGKGRLLVRTRFEDDCVVVSVEDTGGGIPDDVRDRVFDPFFTTRQVGDGSGQGLAMAHATIVARHGGSLTFESTEGRGTTFEVRLPCGGVEQRLEEVAA